MNFDLGQIVATIIFWFVLGLFLGGLIVWAVMTQNPSVLGWVHYHTPWLYSLINIGFTCPSGFSCIKQ